MGRNLCLVLSVICWGDFTSLPLLVTTWKLRRSPRHQKKKTVKRSFPSLQYFVLLLCATAGEILLTFCFRKQMWGKSTQELSQSISVVGGAIGRGSKRLQREQSRISQCFLYSAVVCPRQSDNKRTTPGTARFSIACCL